MAKDFIFTSESVTEGHPDKMADQVSDAVLDYILANSKEPKMARVACETVLSNGFCVVCGELKIEETLRLPIQEIVRHTIKEIGYTEAEYGFDYKHSAILDSLGQQSPDINMGVDRADGEVGAGDQGMMFGYACNETPELMPLPISLAHKLTRKLAELRKNGSIDYLRPDGKAQVSIKYVDGKPLSVENVVISTQHHDGISQDAIKQDVLNKIIKEIIPSNMLTDATTYHINPTGQFIVGGPQGDAGLTGRKIIVDTYGGYCPHGGGAFSGKDPSKVDRSGAYIARYVAKNLVAAGVCDKATVQIAYAIGVVEPVSLLVDTHGTAKVDEAKLTDCVRSIFRLTPKGIIESLDLVRPIYKQTAAYGHFGRTEHELSWERTDKVSDIRSYFKI